MAMRIPVLINPKCEHYSRVADAVDTVNQLQTFFRLSLTAAGWLPNDDRRVKPADILKQVEERFRQTPVIAVIQNLFSDDSFSYEYRNFHIITVGDWERVFAPPPLKIYLSYSFASAMLSFAIDLPVEMDNWE